MVRNHRAVGAIEPIEGDAVFVADLLRRADGQRSRSGFVLALSVVPAGKLSARGKNRSPLASRASCCSNRLKTARMPPPVRTEMRAGCNTRFQPVLAACSGSSAMTLVVHLRLQRRDGAHILARSSRPTMMRAPLDTADPGDGE